MSLNIPRSILSWALMILAAVISVAGIILAAKSEDPVGMGGRGGALAVAISFGILFARETSAENAFSTLVAIRRNIEKVTSSPRTGPDPMVDAILKILTERSGAQARQNVALAIVGVLGTLAWGFGDLAAVALYPKFHNGKPYVQNAGALLPPAPAGGRTGP